MILNELKKQFIWFRLQFIWFCRGLHKVEEKEQDQELQSSYNPRLELPIGQAVVAQNYRTGDRWVPGIITAYPGPLYYEIRV